MSPRIVERAAFGWCEGAEALEVDLVEDAIHFGANGGGVGSGGRLGRRCS